MNNLKFRKMENLMRQMSKSTLVIALFGLIMLMGSCGESVDPSMSDVKLEMRATTQLSTINTNARVSDYGIEFTEVLIGVTEIEFEGMESSHNDGNDDSDDDDSDDDSGDDHNDDGNHDDDSNEIEFEGQYIVDLLNGTSNPDFGMADILPGVYKELEVKISPIMDDGNSIFVQFNYQIDSMTVTVEYSSNREIELKLENKSGMQFNGNAINEILILFDLDKLIAGVDLSMVTADSDGVIRINSSSNAKMATMLWQNIDNAFKAGEDHDGNHKIDDDDDDDDDDDHHSDDD